MVIIFLLNSIISLSIFKFC